MPSPLVTVSSAMYNASDTFLDMVRSIFAQTMDDWELLLIDDGSTDGTANLAESIADPRVRVVRNGRNLGRAASLNRVTSLARGKYIARMDADDLCGMERLAKQVTLLEADPHLDVVGTGICYLDRHDEPLGTWQAPSSHDSICREPLRTVHLCHGSIMGHKTWFEANPYDESLKLAIDFNLFFRTYERSQFANVPEGLYYYRLDQSFNLQKQFAARQAGARFLRREMAQRNHPVQGCLAAAVQYGKFLLTVGMFATGLRRTLMARRFAELNKERAEHYTRELSLIKATDISLVGPIAKQCSS